MPRALAAVLLPLSVSISCTGQGEAQRDPFAPENFVDQVGQYVTVVTEDSCGHLWFGTFGRGVARYDGERLVYFTAEDGLSEGPVTSIVEDPQGRVWFGTHGGVSRCDGGRFVTLGAVDGVTGDEGSVALDRRGRVWVSTRDGVFVDDGQGYRPFPLPEGLGGDVAHAVRQGRVSFALEDRAGNYWFRSDGHGALRFDGASFHQFTKADGLCSNCVNAIHEDLRGRVWFLCMQAYQPRMTGDGGLCRWDGDGFTTFGEIAGLAHNDLYSIYGDRAGNVWVGATGHGIYRFDGEEFVLFDDVQRRDLTPHLGVTGILEDRRGAMWFGLSGGLFRLEGDTLVNVEKTGPWR